MSSTAFDPQTATTRTQLTGYRHGDPPAALHTREWLVTNGLGGYTSGTISGQCTRRFHGLLVAALPPPLGRTMLWNHLADQVVLAPSSAGGRGRVLALSAVHEGVRAVWPDHPALAEFRLELGIPVWRYAIEHDGHHLELEKRVLMPHRQNGVVVLYRLLAAPAPVTLVLRPSFQMRVHEGLLGEPPVRPYSMRVEGARCEIHADARFPALRMRVSGAAPHARTELVLDDGSMHRAHYALEQARGYDYEGTLYSPGYYRAELHPGGSVGLVGSVEPWEVVDALTPEGAAHAEEERRRRLLAQAHPRAQVGLAAHLVLAADQFIITPLTRPADAARAHALGDHARTVIAGYHWFTDWGRDTMISLEGLTLATGRHQEAGYILRTFAHHVRDGLIPNLFPEGESEGLYHTADATLWFFHALERYVQATSDLGTLERMLPVLKGIVDHHVRGTHFGIGVDPRDGLLRQGAQGYQLTWMDAKVEDWVVTPRRGKAVEINALFYNALRLLEGWLTRVEGPAAARDISELAARVGASFNERFPNPRTGYLFDVVDGEQGDDDALRPNQILAVSLDHPVLDASRWREVVQAVQTHLLTPVGLRSLDPRHPDYKARYDGELRARDAAYHQGTVWGWLIGPFLDAYLRVYPDDRAGAAAILEGFRSHLSDASIGSISEIFDAAEPFTPRGCAAQAWSVAEVLRCLLKVSEPATE